MRMPSRLPLVAASLLVFVAIDSPQKAGADGLTLPFTSPSYYSLNSFYDHDQPGCLNCGTMVRYDTRT
jgi:hypothetical protein